jgi:hypothetical protein
LGGFGPVAPVDEKLVGEVGDGVVTVSALWAIVVSSWFCYSRKIMTITEARQIELDVSDAERHAYMVSALDKDGVAIDETTDVFDSYKEALKVAKKLARESGLPLVFRTVHPAFG